TFVARAAAIDVITGSRDITFGGVGELDGARGPEDTIYNGIAIFGRAVRRLQVGGGIYFHDWDHGGVMLGPALECQVDGWYKDIGWRTPQLGAAVWLFRNASRCVVAGQYGNCNIAVALDDRSTHAHLDDNPSDENVVIIRNVRGVGSAVVHSGACHNAVVIESLADWDVAGIAGNAPQWSTEPVCGENLFQIGRMERGGAAPPGTAVELSRAYAYARNVVRFRTNPPAGTVPPGVFVFGPAAGIAPFTGGLGAVPDPVIIVSHQAGGYLDVASPAAAGMPILVVILRNPGAAPLQGIRWPRSLRPARVMDPPGPGRWRVVAFAWDAAARHWGELVRSLGDLS
ncbi:MAG TPA: hypothetical protein VFL95_11965, partial [Gemmatimonadales bacterium]|nr:hypothetical protein [Gemmatimonadales bacterium]